MEEEIVDSKRKYQLLFKYSISGIAFHDIVYDQVGNPINYIITDVNPMYEAILSIKKEDAINALATDLYETQIPPYLEIYSEVASTLEPASFTTFFEPMNKHFKISAFSFEKGRFITVFEDITEQMQAASRIAESEKKYRNMINNLDAGYFIVGLDGTVLYHNRAFNKIAGFDESEELTGLRMPNLWQNPTERQKYLDELTSKGFINNYIVNGVNKYGEKVVLQANAHLVKDANDKPVNIEATFLDITEKYDLEQRLIESERDLRVLNEELELKVLKRTQALKDSERRFRSLVEATSDWIWEVDENGIYTYSSPKIKDLLGFEPEEIIGKKTPFDLMSPDDAIRIINKFNEITKSRKPFAGLENKNIHKDGHIVRLETSGVPIFDSNGTYKGYRGIDRDISKRKHAEEELLLIKEAVHNSSNAIGMSDPEGHHFYQNKAFSHLFKYETAEELDAAGGGPAVYVDPDIAREVFNNIMSGGSWVGELEMRSKNGRVFPAFLRADAIKDEQNNVALK